MIRRSVAVAALAAVVLLPLTGCWNARELEHMFYAHALGIDYIDGKYKVYVQILDFQTLGKQEVGGQASTDEQGSWVGMGDGETVQTALHQLYATTQRRIYWGHLNAIVFSESLLKRGIHEVLDIITRYNELRYVLWVFGTRSPMESILLASPILESSPVYSQLGDPQDVYSQSSYIRPRRLYGFMADMMEPGVTSLLPMLHLSQGHWRDNKTQFDALEMNGVDILKDGRWRGFLSRKQLLGKRWMDKNAKRLPLALGKKDEPIVVVFREPNVRVIPEIRDGGAYFRMKVEVQGSIGEMAHYASQADIIRQSERAIAEEIRMTYAAGLQQQSDPLNLLEVLYRKKVRDWKRLTDSGERFPLNERSLAEVKVSVRLTDSGRTLRSFSAGSGGKPPGGG